MNEIDPWMSLPLWVLYGIQNQIFLHTSHFILSIIDVHLDAVSCDKLIFPSAITRIFHHFSIPFPSFDHFPVMCAIDYATVKRSKAQLQARQSDSAAPPSHSAPSRSAPSSSSDDVTLVDVMAQLQHVDACLDTLSTEFYQVNIRVGCIPKLQATMGEFLVMRVVILRGRVSIGLFC